MCPTSFEVRLSSGERSRLIFWQEPTFADNIGVEHVYKTRVCVKVLYSHLIFGIRYPLQRDIYVHDLQFFLAFYKYEHTNLYRNITYIRKVYFRRSTICGRAWKFYLQYLSHLKCYLKYFY